MRNLPRTAQIYLWAVMLITAWVLVATFPQLWPALADSPRDIFLSAIGVVGLFYWTTHTIPIGYSTVVHVSGSVVFAGVLLLPISVTTWVTAVGMGAAYLYLNHVLGRRPWYNTTFNVANWTLTANVACAFWRLWGPASITPLEMTLPSLIATGVVYVLCNAGLVSGMHALRRRQNWLSTWWSIVRLGAAYTGSADVMIGTLTAAVVQFAGPVGLILVVIPTAFFYYSLRVSYDLRVQTIEAVQVMADVIDQRDRYTFDHSQRVSKYAELIATKMRLPPEQIETLRMSARVHDLGKIGIDGSMLHKPGALTSDERDRFQRHVYVGAMIIERFPRYREGREIVLYHHERYDGDGYPERLIGTDIPLGARIVA
ncbi:MAG: HD domain-containing protein, partial [Chloroflexi bacterium]|nr:HD domain-containing protein [Chloroflexota bacterium]